MNHEIKKLQIKIFTLNVCTNNSMYYVVNKTIVNKLKDYLDDFYDNFLVKIKRLKFIES